MPREVSPPPLRSRDQVAATAPVMTLSRAMTVLQSLGYARLVLSAACLACEETLGRYEDPDQFPDELPCPSCGGVHPFDDLEVRVEHELLNLITD